MVESTIGALRARPVLHALARMVWLVVWLAVCALITLNLGFFAQHAAQVLRHPFPLDYGEGPLLTQVNLLRSGVSLHQLYGPLDAPPHLVVNYPPVYLLVTLAVSFITNDVLLAGRLVSLGATLACVGALFVLTTDDRQPTTAHSFSRRSSVVGRLLICFAFLALPIVREWAVLMRVDILGVALGLWGLAALRAEWRVESGEWRVPNVEGKVPSAEWRIRPLMFVAAVLLVLSLFTKPSLLAAPMAALLVLLLLNWRRGLLLGGMLTLLGGAAFGLLTMGSSFFQHVVVANANAWEGTLAVRFWRQVAIIHWPLFLAGAIGTVLAARRWPGRTGIRVWALPLVYTLVGVATAIGVGKVGAYLNYFLELYAGLVWLVMLGVGVRGEGETVQGSGFRVQGSGFFALPLKRSNAQTLKRFAVLALLAAALVRYYPVWSESTTKLAGVIEGANPPRLIVGRRGVWQDLRRQRQILQVMERTNAALVGEVRAAGGPILGDIPGIAAQAGQIGRLQAFEHSQITEWDQRDLRLDLANGRVPLVVLDYLGNWLSPEVIALIRHRYAQTGSRGTYDLYRSLDPGPARALDLRWEGGLRLAALHLVDRAYHGGEPLIVTLRWQAEPHPTFQARSSTVLLTLHDSAGRAVATSALPFVYGAISTAEIPPDGVQHMQVIQFPANTAPGTYMLSAAIEATGMASSAQEVATITVEGRGTILPNGSIEGGDEYVPEPLVAAWQQLGGETRLGLPITPAIPFVGAVQQCFERGCLRLERGQVTQAPVGEWLSVGDIGANGALEQPSISAIFQPFYQQHGGVMRLGKAVTNEFRSGDRMMQYTQFARLERPLDGGPASFGNIGEDVLRLPVGTPYRWP